LHSQRAVTCSARSLLVPFAACKQHAAVHGCAVHSDAKWLSDPWRRHARCRPGCIVTGGVDMPTRRMNIGATSAPRSIASIVMASLESGFETSVQRELDS
jgi:hypothetical protein